MSGRDWGWGTVRGRTAGLLLALILLVAAVPAILDCCFHAPDHGPYAAQPAVARIPATSPGASSPVESTRGCVDHAAPSQNPYIETANGGGGGAPASSRNAEAAIDRDAALTATTAYSARRSAIAADSTGPPLWLSTCVSRT